MAGFGSLYVVGGSRLLYSYGLYNGGPVALWTSMLVTVVLMCVTGEFPTSSLSRLLRETDKSVSATHLSCMSR